MAFRVTEPATFSAQADPSPSGWGYGEISAFVAPLIAIRSSQRSEPADVLEAGGGSAVHVPMPAGTRITTIDISPEQLASNEHAHEKLLGDLQTFDYGARRYDLIVCWDVLEHLADPQAAISRFARILKPGGQVLIVGPHPRTLKGLAAKFTPHWAHVAFYRHVLGATKAGLPGHFPFRTEHAVGAAPDDIGASFTSAGLAVETLKLYESVHVTKLRRWSRPLYWMYRAAEWTVSAVSAGRIRRGVTDFCLIARRPG